MKKLLVGLAVLAACHKASDERLQTADALWSLAPEGAKIGVVVTPRALAMLEHGLQDARAFMAKAPDLAPIGQMLDAQIRELTGTDNLQLTDIGLTADKGAAYFGTGPDGGVVIVPLADRDKFLAKVHGTKGGDGDTVDHGVCKAVKDYYACASDAAILATLGKGTLRGKLETRGDIELVAADVPGMPMKYVAVAAQLERGALTLHGTLDGLPALLTSKLGSPLTLQVDREHTVGFGAIDLGALLSLVPDVPIGAGVSTASLARSLAGPMYLSALAAAPMVDVRVPLKDPAPAQTLIDKCAELLPAQLGFTSQGGTCSSIESAMGPAIDAWIDGTTLRIGKKTPPAPATVPLDHVGSELASGSWNLVFWGRGSLLSGQSFPLPAAMLQEPKLQAVARVVTMVNEMGFAARVDGEKLKVVMTVRTAFCNPDDVVARLAAIPVADIIANKSSELGRPFATGSTPLAEDIKAGPMGLTIPMAFELLAVNFVLGMTGEADEPPSMEPTTP